MFIDSHQYAVGAFQPTPQFPVVGGGQIDLDPCTDTAAVVGNTFQGGQRGPGDGNTQGMELHGTDLSIVNNLIEDNWHDGISLGGAANVFIANWDKHSAITGNMAAGIATNQGNYYDSERPIDFITIDDVVITNNSYWGILVDSTVVPVNHLSITNTCLQGNGYSPAISLITTGPDVFLSNNQLSGCGSN